MTTSDVPAKTGHLDARASERATSQGPSPLSPQPGLTTPARPAVSGLPPARAGSEVEQAPTPAGTTGTFALAVALLDALEGFEDAAAQTALDRLFAERPLPAALTDVILPSLAELGRRWAVGEASVAQEHFASQVIRTRLMSLAQGWGSGPGPRTLLACAPQEHHDLPLIAFGLALHHRGWTVAFLGADVPFADIARAADRVPDAVVVLSATVAESLSQAGPELMSLAARAKLALAGPAVTEADAAQIGAKYLRGDPVAAAELLDQRFRTAPRQWWSPSAEPAAGVDMPRRWHRSGPE